MNRSKVFMSIRLHHFGIVATNIESYLSQSLWELRGSIITDPIQGARLCMAGLPSDIAAMIELVEPLDETSPAWRTLQQGLRWHHVCLSVPTILAGERLMRQRRLLPVTPWQPAVLFGGRAIRFVYSRNKELIEFLSDEVTS